MDNLQIDIVNCILTIITYDKQGKYDAIITLITKQCNNYIRH